MGRAAVSNTRMERLCCYLRHILPSGWPWTGAPDGCQRATGTAERRRTGARTGARELPEAAGTAERGQPMCLRGNAAGPDGSRPDLLQGYCRPDRVTGPCTA
jgi:hypothetical protein